MDVGLLTEGMGGKRRLAPFKAGGHKPRAAPGEGAQEEQEGEGEEGEDTAGGHQNRRGKVGRCNVRVASVGWRGQIIVFDHD